MSKRQHPTKQKLYGHLPPTTKTIKIRRIRHAGQCWRIKDELISDVFPLHGRAKEGWLARTYLQQLCTDTGCSLEDRLGVMDDRDRWWERVREICASSTTWWWWLVVRSIKPWIQRLYRLQKFKNPHHHKGVFFRYNTKLHTAVRFQF